MTVGKDLQALLKNSKTRWRASERFTEFGGTFAFRIACAISDSTQRALKWWFCCWRWGEKERTRKCNCGGHGTYERCRIECAFYLVATSISLAVIMLIVNFTYLKCNFDHIIFYFFAVPKMYLSWCNNVNWFIIIIFFTFFLFDHIVFIMVEHINHDLYVITILL